MHWLGTLCGGRGEGGKEGGREGREGRREGGGREEEERKEIWVETERREEKRQKSIFNQDYTPNVSDHICYQASYIHDLRLPPLLHRPTHRPTHIHTYKA